MAFRKTFVWVMRKHQEHVKYRVVQEINTITVNRCLLTVSLLWHPQSAILITHRQINTSRIVKSMHEWGIL